MANKGTSSSRFEEEEEEEMEELYGAESGCVEARSSCDHPPSLASDLVHIPPPDSPCFRNIYPLYMLLLVNSCNQGCCPRTRRLLWADQLDWRVSNYANLFNFMLNLGWNLM